MLNNNSGCENNRGRRFVGGVLLLSASTLICKLIGLFFKIPIINIVGIEGMAFFSAAYNVYMLLNSIAAAGLPVALSIIVSKYIAEGKHSDSKKAFWVAMLVFSTIGALGTIFLFTGADLYSETVGLADASLSVKTIAPTIFLITVSGGLRGYFQGHEIMAPTAVSQLLESLGKLIFGVGLAIIAIRKGLSLPYIAAAAISGISLGVLLSVFFLIVTYFFFRQRTWKTIRSDGDKPTDKVGKIVGELFWIALPITLSSCLTSITSLADTALITNGLIASGFAEDTSVALYSSYTNLAIPLFNLIPALVTPLAVSLIPTITSAITRKDRREADAIFSSAIRLCIAFCLPSAAGMAVFSKPILEMIYPSEAQACSFAAPLLSMLTLAIVFSCLTTIFNAVLQSYMKPAFPIVSMAAGATVKIILEYILVRTSAGISGAPISTVAGCLVIMMMNIIFITAFTPHRLDFKCFFKALAATAICIASAMIVYCVALKLEAAFQFALILAICAAAFVYAIVALKLGVVGAFEISHLPLASRILPILRKLKLLK